MNAQSHWMVLFEALTHNEAGCFYNDQLFSGVAIKHEQGLVVGRLIYREGEQLGDYVPPYLNQPEHAILDTVLESVLEPICVNGKPYSGIVYSVSQNGHASGENVFVDGWEGQGTNYHCDSNIRHELELESMLGEGDLLKEMYEWDELGGILSWDVALKSTLNDSRGSIAFKVGQANEISHFTVTGEFCLIIDNSEKLVCPYDKVVEELSGFNTDSISELHVVCSERIYAQQKALQELISALKPVRLAVSRYECKWDNLIAFAATEGTSELEVVSVCSEQEKAALHTLMARQYPHVKMI
ncbi:hypothetical protein L1285_20325 [Pseudoalteromonas sp. DL2-H2.2]|uniref:hypothetical protein n=1 Tax=Pseudoalteromonas sp. DL2-H2.2 TaxID=2908889 RepID=UPI001F383D15|nr:hypothetical protein [Pseudoalteromonas sp. DL2-H2.2]MCF2910657.1 hypothetical protein [Pseudoalteromonas sp. DL2-H2.2]